MDLKSKIDRKERSISIFELRSRIAILPDQRYFCRSTPLARTRSKNKRTCSMTTHQLSPLSSPHNIAPLVAGSS